MSILLHVKRKHLRDCVLVRLGQDVHLHFHEVFLHEGLLWVQNARDLGGVVLLHQLLPLRGVLDNTLLKLVFSHEADKLIAEVGELYRVLALLVLAHELEDPVLHEVDAHRLQVRAHREHLALPSQTPLQANLDVLHYIAVCLEHQSFQRRPFHIAEAKDLVAVVFRLNGRLYCEVKFPNHCGERGFRQVVLVHHLGKGEV